MKNILYVFVLFLGLSSCQEKQKIGFVDNGVIINDYQSKKDIETKYKAKDAAFQKRADSIGQAFQLEAQTFQANAKTMTEKAQQETYQALGQKQQALKQQMQTEQQEIQLAFQQEIDTLIIEVKDFVKNYGKENGYTYILGTSETAATVLYGTEENDLTQTILDALNKEYKK